MQKALDSTQPSINDSFTITLNKSDLKNLSNAHQKTDLSHLDENGELPWGWIYQNREFTDKIQKEYSFFLNQWISSRNTLNEYAALKSLILYIEDGMKLCDSFGECHVKWFNDCIADSDYLKKRKSDLESFHLHNNGEQMQM